jgi:hypothetical protein
VKICCFDFETENKYVKDFCMAYNATGRFDVTGTSRSPYMQYNRVYCTVVLTRKTTISWVENRYFCL